MKPVMSLLLSFFLLFISCAGAPGNNLSIPDEPGTTLQHSVFIGASLGSGEPTAQKISIFKQQSGRDLSMAVWFLGWDQPFPVETCKTLYDDGVIPHITWEPHFWYSDDKITLNDIISGKHDDYILSWAEGIREYGGPLFIRLMHEFNGNWYDWGIANNGNDPQRYIAAWRHVHDLLSENGAENVKYIWNVGHDSLPDEDWNNPLLAYPGDDYVDWIGIDGYNWGTFYEWSSWKEFDEVFIPMYDLLVAAYPDKPIMIPETATLPNGGDRAEWISQIPEHLNRFPNIKAIAWFDVVKEGDYRAAATAESARAWKIFMNEEYIKSDHQELWAVE